MIDLLLLFGLLGLCLYFLSGQRVRELSLSAARKACGEAGAQLLDESVIIRKLSFSRDSNGQWRIWRLYHFEYSYDGDQRLLGRAIMLGQRKLSIVLQERGPQQIH